MHFTPPARRLVAIALGLALVPVTAVATSAMAEPAPETAAAAGTATPKPAITKVLTFVVENHSLAQMRDSMPYTNRLATRYAYADNYTAITHPSLPNYLAIASGSTHGVVDDAGPDSHQLGGTTVFDQAIRRHKTARLYVDSMTSNCQRSDDGRYAVKHNPWVYFVNGRRHCQRFDVPINKFAGDATSGELPNLAMVIPDLVHDAHDAPLATADTWLKKKIKLVRAGPDWASGHLAIVITADEDDRLSGNKVLTVVASRYQSHLVVHTALTHYSLTRLFDSVVGAGYLGNADTAPSMSDAFAITTP